MWKSTSAWRTASRASSVAASHRRTPATSSTARARPTSCTASGSSAVTKTPRLGSRVASPSATSTPSASRIVDRDTPIASASAISRNGVPGPTSPSNRARRSSSATRSTVEECSRLSVANGLSGWSAVDPGAPGRSVMGLLSRNVWNMHVA